MLSSDFPTPRTLLCILRCKSCAVILAIHNEQGPALPFYCTRYDTWHVGVLCLVVLYQVRLSYAARTYQLVLVVLRLQYSTCTMFNCSTCSTDVLGCGCSVVTVCENAVCSVQQCVCTCVLQQQALAAETRRKYVKTCMSGKLRPRHKYGVRHGLMAFLHVSRNLT